MLLKDVQRRTLPNGLTVLLKPDPRVPAACVLTWANVGYFNEPDKLVGISHFIEHMFYKGTPTREVGAIARETKALGGYLNAATIYDYTYYYSLVPSNKLHRALDIQADALMHPLFDRAEMEKEKDVIIQEVKRKFDNPNPYAWEKLLEMAFDSHRIRRWRMGREEDIRGYTRDEVAAYYQRYYRASNIVLCVVGQFDVEKVWPEIERRYGEMPGGELDAESSPSEPPQKVAKLSRLVGDVSRVLIKMGFHAASLHDDDYHALTFLSALLGRGRSSRLERTLKEEKQLVDSITSSFFAAKDVGFFTIEAETRPDKIAACEEEIWMELEKLRRDPPTKEEIDKVRSIVETNFFSEREDLMGQSYSLAFFESLGGYEKIGDYLERMRSVNAHDLVRVAKKYFEFSKMSLLEYVPAEVGEGASADLRLESLEKRVSAGRQRLEPETQVPEVRENVPEIALPHHGDELSIRRGPKVIPIEGGPTLLHLKTGSLPLVSLGVYFPGGRLDETQENCGITRFVLANSLRGSASHSADEIAFAMESLGTSIHFEATADFFGYSMNLLSRNLEPGMKLLSEIVFHPTYPSAEMEKERESTLARIRKTRDDMFRYPIQLFYQALYGLHPYGLPRAGSEQSIKTINREQLLEWSKQIFRWRQMVVTLVGDIEEERAVSLVKELFSVSDDGDEMPRAQIIPVIPDRGVRENAEERNRKQTGLVFGFPGVGQKDERYYVLEVLRNIVSGMGGRLFTEIRDRRALVYTVTAFNIGLLRGGAFFVYLASSPGKELEAREAVKSELLRLTRKKCTEDELIAAKAFTKGSYVIAQQGNRAIAYEALQQFMLTGEVKGIQEYDRKVSAVSAEDVRLAAKSIFRFDQGALGVVRGK